MDDIEVVRKQMWRWFGSPDGKPCECTTQHPEAFAALDRIEAQFSADVRYKAALERIARGRWTTISTTSGRLIKTSSSPEMVARAALANPKTEEDE